MVSELYKNHRDPNHPRSLRSCLDHVDAQISGEVARAQDSNHALTINEVFRIPS
eukprot:m.306690 g.306690  ORF g.306690 m.306690 type:complete len:54 (-) comp16352_c0_seq7:3513-3674(-)